jgi:hypothetical protein
MVLRVAIRPRVARLVLQRRSSRRRQHAPSKPSLASSRTVRRQPHSLPALAAGEALLIQVSRRGEDEGNAAVREPRTPPRPGVAKTTTQLDLPQEGVSSVHREARAGRVILTAGLLWRDYARTHERALQVRTQWIIAHITQPDRMRPTAKVCCDRLADRTCGRRAKATMLRPHAPRPQPPATAVKPERVAATTETNGSRPLSLSRASNGGIASATARRAVRNACSGSARRRGQGTFGCVGGP